MIKKLLIFACLIGATMASLCVADTSYVQALPTPAPITGTLSDTGQAFTDASTPAHKPKKSFFHKHKASQTSHYTC